jgi:hypothetical protein
MIPFVRSFRTRSRVAGGDRLILWARAEFEILLSSYRIRKIPLSNSSYFIFLRIIYG